MKETAMICSHVFMRESPILLVSRDSGRWSCLCGQDHSEHEKIQIVPLEDLVAHDRTLEKILDLPEFWAAERQSIESEWERKPLFYSMSGKEYESFSEGALDHLESLMEKFNNEYGVDAYESYEFDETSESLSFLRSDGTGVSFRVVGIGSYLEDKKTWMWDWANDSVGDSLRDKSERLRELFYVTGDRSFNEPVLNIGEDRMWEFVAMSVAHLKALGYYAIEEDGLLLLFAFVEKMERQ